MRGSSSGLVTYHVHAGTRSVCRFVLTIDIENVIYTKDDSDEGDHLTTTHVSVRPSVDVSLRTPPSEPTSAAR